MFKQLKKISVAAGLMVALTACSSMTQNSSVVSAQEGNNIVLEGKVTEQLVIDSQDDVTVTLKNVTATMQTSVISVENANSVTIVLEGENTLATTGTDTNTIDSKDDLIVTGSGTLNIQSNDNGIKSNDDLTIEGGTLNITAGSDGLKANETLTINGGTMNIEAAEALEATEIIINDGTIDITAYDDGMNASQKSDTKTPMIEINGGDITIQMAQGDTDAVDSNGSLYINGGTLNISAQFAFDYVSDGQLNGGTVIVNGEEITQLTNSMMEGPMGGMENGMQLMDHENGQNGMMQGFRR
jgi:hypothetical protein